MVAVIRQITAWKVLSRYRSGGHSPDLLGGLYKLIPFPSSFRNLMGVSFSPLHRSARCSGDVVFGILRRVDLDDRRVGNAQSTQGVDLMVVGLIAVWYFLGILNEQCAGFMRVAPCFAPVGELLALLSLRNPPFLLLLTPRDMRRSDMGGCTAADRL
jgi:hypothetical protein